MRFLRLFVAACIGVLLSYSHPIYAHSGAPNPCRYFWTDDEVRHFVTERGVGEPVIVLHGGWGADYTSVIGMIESHVDDYRFILYDQRGSLRSPAPANTIDMGRLLDDLEALRKELGLEKMTLLGHSMGSIPAYSYLIAYPENVKALILSAAGLPRQAGEILDETSLENLYARYEEFREERQALIRAERLKLGLVDAENPDELREGSTGRERTAFWRINYGIQSIHDPAL